MPKPVLTRRPLLCRLLLAACLSVLLFRCCITSSCVPCVFIHIIYFPNQSLCSWTESFIVILVTLWLLLTNRLFANKRIGNTFARFCPRPYSAENILVPLCDTKSLAARKYRQVINKSDFRDSIKTKGMV